MKLNYEQAMVSYNPDLTDPQALSVPIAVLVVGQLHSAEGVSGWIAAIAGIDAKQLGVDPLSAAMLSDVPHLIRRHVDAAIESAATDATPHSILSAFFESLKTSIHVSEFSKAITATVRNPKAAADRVTTVAIKSLISRVGRVPTKRPPQGRWAPRVTPKSLAQPPEHSFWRPSTPEIRAAG